MIHPVFRLAVSQPLLVAEHAAAYVALAAEELAIRFASLQRRLLLQVVGVAGLLVAAVLAGVAVLLWASLPAPAFREPWLVFAAPVLPAVLGVWALLMARAREDDEPFAQLRVQLAQDSALLRKPLVP